VDADIVVVGGGVMGLATAWRAAAAHGAGRVLLLEQFAIGHDRGSSHGPTRVFRYAYDRVEYVRMAREARALWPEVHDEDGAVLTITGGIEVGAREHTEPVHAALTAGGAACEWVPPSQRAARFPWLATESDVCLYSPDTGVIGAARAIRALTALARSSGAELREQSTVEQLVVDDGGVTLAVAGGAVRARRCVVTAGPWAASLLAPLGIDLGVRVTEEVIQYHAVPVAPMPVIDRGATFFYSVPALHGAPGVKAGAHGAGRVVDPAARDGDGNPAASPEVSDWVARTFREAVRAPVAAETCLYTTTQAEEFILDARGPLVVGSPCSGHGFKFAPLVGEVLACLAGGREPPVPLDRFRLAAFR